LKFLGVDYGQKRIGVAVSDNGIYARPLCTIENRGQKKNLEAIRKLLATDTVVVFGLPKGSRLLAEIRALGDELGAVYHDEYLSSVAAEQHIRDTKSKNTVDEVAATMILQSFIEKHYI